VYSAEIINTLTNLLFMYLATKGIRNCLANGHDTVFLVAFVGYLLVGTGSFLFHATLKCKWTDWTDYRALILMRLRSYAAR
jgi:dihydroceramidase